MANYTGWGYLFTFLGFVIICIAVARDAWTESIRDFGSWDQATNGPLFNTSSIIHHHRRTFDARPTPGSSRDVPGYDPYPTYYKAFGTHSFHRGFTYGFSYELPCPGGNDKEINAQHAGMIAVLLSANLNGFIASIVAIFAATRSTITESFVTPRQLAFSAFISTLIAWCLWLGTNKILTSNSSGECHFQGKTQLAPDVDVASASRHVSVSFGLMLVSSVIYFFDIFWLHHMVKNAHKPTQGRKTTVLLAIIAYGFCFCATVYNVWTDSNITDIAKEMEKYDEGSSYVGTQYGVGSAVFYATTYFDYNNTVYRHKFCPLLDTEFDGAGTALEQSGRVVLGFGITAIVLGLPALYLQAVRHPYTFFFSLGSFLSIVVCLVVWANADTIIRERCCDALQCEFGTSYGLAAISAGFFAAAVVYNGWVMADDVYVLHAPEEYGMQKY